MRTSVFCLLGILALVIPVLAADEDQCDLKTIIKMRYCVDEERLLEKNEVVSGHTYYICEECDLESDKPGNCPDCEDSKLVAKKTGDNVCKHCYGETEEVEVCEKVYYECSDCGCTAMKPGKCPDCEDHPALEKQVSRALIVYECPECGATSPKPGKCTDPECEGHGKPLRKTCTESGTPPHVR